MLDGMALIGATALGLGLTRAVFADLISGIKLDEVANWQRAEYAEVAALGLSMAMPSLACLSAAVASLSLLGPRSARRRLGRRPGFLAAAGVAATFGLGLPYTFGLILLLNGWQGGMLGWDEIKGGLVEVMAIGHGVPGLVVAASWALLWSIGRWRPSRDWLDRAGRALGLVWIALLIGSPIALAVMMS